MRFPSRHAVDEGKPGTTGTARLDRRTSALVRRLRPGDVAVIDHLDLDRATAEALLECRVTAVVNASAFISGRYPNLGPELLARAGVVLVDSVGTDIFRDLHDGNQVRLHEGEVLVGDRAVASGRRLDLEQVQAQMEEARAGLSSQLQTFTHNTTEFLRREQDLLLHGQGAPRTATPIGARPVVVVSRGYDFQQDLRRLRRFIHEQRPVLIGVDAGADALLAAGHRPDVVVVGEQGLGQNAGEGERGSRSVSDKALRAARDVILHADSAGHATGSGRLERLGVRPRTMSASGTSEDMALLLADIAGASFIVPVGTHATLDEFLDRQRAGLASTFLTRLRVGPKLVDAKTVPQLYSGRVRAWQLALVLLVAVAALLVAIATTPVGGQWWSSVSAALGDFPDWIQGLFS